MRGLLPALAASVSLYVAVTGHVATAESDQGAQLAATCASCHRLDGRDKGIPPIAGLDADKLIGMMEAYKLNVRPSLIMRGVSLSLSADEIAAIARYMAAQRGESTPR
jgi:cytochrome subunit of sulfide dehydrogenase